MSGNVTITCSVRYVVLNLHIPLNFVKAEIFRELTAFVESEQRNKPSSRRTTATRVEEMFERAAELRADLQRVDKAAVNMV